MKKTNKSKEVKKDINQRKKILISNNSSLSNKKEKIIIDLKQKGFNEHQIKDIFDTLNQNIKGENINNTRMIKTINNKKENFNKRSLNQNYLLLRKNQNSYNENNIKSSYLKLSLNTSLNKLKNHELNTSKNKDSNNQQRKLNIINLDHKKDKNNSSYSKIHKDVRNIKIANYLKKYNSHSGYATNINSPKKINVNLKTENKNNKKFILNKCTQLKIIPIKRKTNDINSKLKTDNSKNKKILNSTAKRNINPNFNKIKINNPKEKLFSSKYSPKHENLHTHIKKDILKYKFNSIKNKLNLVKTKESQNKLIEDKIVVNKNKQLGKNIIPISSNRNSTFLNIRKQKSKEDDIIAQRNTGIIEIKIDNAPHSSRCTMNQKYLHTTSSSENKFKEYHSNNANHNFVNINLCKDKTNNDVIQLGDKFLTKQNSFPNFKYKITIKNDENKIKNSFDDNNKNIKENNSSKNSNNHIVFRSYHSSGETKAFNYLNKNNKIEENKKDEINNVNQIKIFENGKYEGIIIDDKREIKGVMIYNNGARYEGEWKDNKKNGKGIFISSHYLNCENKPGLKYEGEFFDDKFDGYGKVLYSNGDRYEGEWKNNKQYGKGILINFSGTRYEGEWIDGKIEGEGKYYMNNGDMYEGHFSNNKFNGYGKYFYNNGNYIEGIFKDDRPTANSIMHRKDEY